ncbi:MAG: hypothetical protein Q9M19_03785, partial [Mariprofundaceae bacterium]|nr:hypothetical protein [Mariprofundaceae bacterium]
VHAASLDTGHIAEHLHDDGADHDQDSNIHACHVHASHAFQMTEVAQTGSIPMTSIQEHYKLTGIRIKSVPFLIEHPPKILHS